MCRHWAATTSGVQAMGFSRTGIGVFVVAALGFLGVGIGVFAVAALGFSGVGIGVFVVAWRASSWKRPKTRFLIASRKKALSGRVTAPL